MFYCVKKLLNISKVDLNFCHLIAIPHFHLFSNFALTFLQSVYLMAVGYKPNDHKTNIIGDKKPIKTKYVDIYLKRQFSTPPLFLKKIDSYTNS